MKLIRGMSILVWLVATLFYIASGDASPFQTLVLGALLLILTSVSEVIFTMSLPLRIVNQKEDNDHD